MTSSASRCCSEGFGFSEQINPINDTLTETGTQVKKTINGINRELPFRVDCLITLYVLEIIGQSLVVCVYIACVFCERFCSFLLMTLNLISKKIFYATLTRQWC